MQPTWREALEVLRFRPDRYPDSMVAIIEGVRIVAVTHPLRGLVLMGVHRDERNLVEFERDVGPAVSVQSISEAILTILEECGRP